MISASHAAFVVSRGGLLVGGDLSLQAIARKPWLTVYRAHPGRRRGVFGAHNGIFSIEGNVTIKKDRHFNFGFLARNRVVKFLRHLVRPGETPDMPIMDYFL